MSVPRRFPCRTRHGRSHWVRRAANCSALYRRDDERSRIALPPIRETARHAYVIRRRGLARRQVHNDRRDQHPAAALAGLFGHQLRHASDSTFLTSSISGPAAAELWDHPYVSICKFLVSTGPASRMTQPLVIHPPCPECQSKRTVPTGKEPTTGDFYCPHCGHIWKVDVPRP